MVSEKKKSRRIRLDFDTQALHLANLCFFIVQSVFTETQFDCMRCDGLNMKFYFQKQTNYLWKFSACIQIAYVCGENLIESAQLSLFFGEISSFQ